MAASLDAFLGLTAGEDVVLRVIVTLSILALGHLSVKLLSGGLKGRLIAENLSKKEAADREDTINAVEYLLDALVIVISLLYLNSGLTSTVTARIVGFLPQLVSVILIGILGFIGINLLARLATEFLSRVGLPSYLQEIGLSGSTVEFVGGVMKAFLYLLLLQISLQQIGIGDTFLNELVTASSWAFAALIAGLVFWGFKDLFQNFAAGIYLKNSRLVRPGEEVRMDEDTGEIREISLFSTTLNTESGYTMLKPNNEIMRSDLRFKRTKNDVETLEEINDYFVSTDSSTAAPASMEMALDIFGYRASQQNIVERSGSKERDDLLKAVEDLTNNKIKTGFVEREKMTTLEDEIKAWFNDGALLVPVFDKSRIFPEASGEDYVLAVGIENNEVLIVDPSTETAGVYFVESSKLKEAMMEQHGYIVLAPENTNAYWRLEKGLLYSDKNSYEELSKTLEARLTKILRQGRILGDVMPHQVQDYIEDWRTERYVSRLWKPGEEEGGEDEASEGNGN